MLGYLESGLEMREVRGRMGGGGGCGVILDWMGHFITKGLQIGFEIWAWIPLFWAVAPVRALA